MNTSQPSEGPYAASLAELVRPAWGKGVTGTCRSRVSSQREFSNSLLGTNRLTFR